MKRIAACGAAIFMICLLCLSAAGCEPTKKVSRFGMDIDRLKPMIVTVCDRQGDAVFFSRDPHSISEAIAMFEKMKLTHADDTTQTKGLTYTVSTMYGDFLLGEYMGARLRIGRTEYTVDKDYTTDIDLLTQRIRAETENIRDVSKETILETRPDMTFRDLLDRFGQTMESSAVNNQISFLYRYGSRPFYLLFSRETDQVGCDGRELMKRIVINYNLGDNLVPADSLAGGRLAVYRQAFDQVIDECRAAAGQGDADSLLIDTGLLAHLDQDERGQLTAYLSNRCGLPVEDGEDAALHKNGDWIAGEERHTLALWIREYLFIGEDRMEFTAAGRLGEDMAVTLPMVFVLRDGEWVM